MKIFLHNNDLPNDIVFTNSVAIDTETMGLKTKRDRLCLVQISEGNENVHLIKINHNQKNSFKNLKNLLGNNKIEKIFHFARFDLAVLNHYIGPVRGPIWCTKIASKISRTYTDKHSLSELCKELLNIDLPKDQQTSNWGNEILTTNQKKYAANDVIFLHKIRNKLIKILKQENRLELAEEVFKFLVTRSKLDLDGFENIDIFAH